MRQCIECVQRCVGQKLGAGSLIYKLGQSRIAKRRRFGVREIKRRRRAQGGDDLRKETKGKKGLGFKEGPSFYRNGSGKFDYS